MPQIKQSSGTIQTYQVNGATFTDTDLVEYVGKVYTGAELYDKYGSS